MVKQETIYFMLRQNLLYRIDGCVWSYQSYDTEKKHRVDGTQLLIYIYMYIISSE